MLWDFIIKIFLLFFVFASTFMMINLDKRVMLLENQKQAFTEKLSQQQEKISNILHGLNLKSVKKLTVTAYSPRKKETDNTPTVTASMDTVRHGGVAISRDLFKRGWSFGKKIYIEGYGVYEINDLMNERFKNRIDIFMWDTNKAKKSGKKELVVALID